MTIQDLTLVEVMEACISRSKRWHPGFPLDDEWNLSDWSNAMMGEAGEAANVVKKIRREKTGAAGKRDTREHLAEELSDVILYLVLVAAKAKISSAELQDAVIEKFNRVSEENDFPERLDWR